MAIAGLALAGVAAVTIWGAAGLAVGTTMSVSAAVCVRLVIAYAHWDRDFDFVVANLTVVITVDLSRTAAMGSNVIAFAATAALVLVTVANLAEAGAAVAGLAVGGMAIGQNVNAVIATFAVRQPVVTCSVAAIFGTLGNASPS